MAEPHAYFVDAISRIVAGHPQSRLDELLPWAYQIPADLKAVAREHRLRPFCETWSPMPYATPRRVRFWPGGGAIVIFRHSTTEDVLYSDMWKVSTTTFSLKAMIRLNIGIASPTVGLR
ncbi:transposase domain-containing protein [Magnetospirillum gryphiswaldense]|uniref:Transposase n=1 Tax=Magnetospirillum gryphiswaldense TaxID=55518 RepID=A4U5B4_9PROT|nr:transposase domain-containing protein [Magnetospirillum gryphiswaldense]CAM78071.1 transposase, fragment [Magnetospirillum gryphiswaldense MSR-1]